MPKLTVVRSDGSVQVDGHVLKVDTTDLPEYIHAVQWDGNAGHIEFAEGKDGQKLPNLPITSIRPFAFLVDRHAVERIRVQEEADRAKAKEEKKAKEAADAKAQQEADAGKSPVTLLKEKQSGQPPTP